MKPTPLRLQHLLLLAIVFANSPVLRADPLAELGGRLEAMAGTTPIEARVELRFSSTRGDDDDQPADPPASIAFEAEANAGHMQLVWSRSVLAQAASEAAIRDPEAPRPVTRALAQVSVPDIDEYRRPRDHGIARRVRDHDRHPLDRPGASGLHPDRALVRRRCARAAGLPG